MSDVRRDYELERELSIDTPTRMKALGDALRCRITELVLERAMSVTELAERLGRPKGTIAYHVDILHDAGLLRVVATRRVRAVEERFYGRTARTYVMPETPGEIPFLRDVIASVDHERGADDPATEHGFATLRHARIPTHRIAEYRERLLALAEEFVDEPRGGDVEFGMYLLLYPADRDRVSDPDQEST